MANPSALLTPFVRQQTALLTAYRRDGMPVGTAVHPVVEGEHVFFRTWNTTGKLKRMRNNPLVALAPSDVRGRPTGPAIRARARLLGGKYPILHSWLIPLGHRLAGKKTVHIELTPVGE